MYWHTLYGVDKRQQMTFSVMRVTLSPILASDIDAGCRFDSRIP